MVMGLYVPSGGLGSRGTLLRYAEAGPIPPAGLATGVSAAVPETALSLRPNGAGRAALGAVALADAAADASDAGFSASAGRDSAEPPPFAPSLAASSDLTLTGGSAADPAGHVCSWAMERATRPSGVS